MNLADRIADRIASRAALTLPTPPEGLTVAQIVSRTKGGTIHHYPTMFEWLLTHHRKNLLFSSDAFYALAHSTDPAMLLRYPAWVDVSPRQGERVLAYSKLDLATNEWQPWRKA